MRKQTRWELETFDSQGERVARFVVTAKKWAMDILYTQKQKPEVVEYTLCNASGTFDVRRSREIGGKRWYTFGTYVPAWMDKLMDEWGWG